jgi:hypothetical protein
MKYFGSVGCPLRKELRTDPMRPCDLAELNGEVVQSALQRSQRIQTYNTEDVV